MTPAVGALMPSNPENVVGRFSPSKSYDSGETGCSTYPNSLVADERLLEFLQGMEMRMEEHLLRFEAKMQAQLEARMDNMEAKMDTRMDDIKSMLQSVLLVSEVRETPLSAAVSPTEVMNMGSADNPLVHPSTEVRQDVDSTEGLTKGGSRKGWIEVADTGSI